MAFAFLSPHEEMRYVLERKDIIMDNIQIFKNESFGEVRVAGTSEEPLFCAKDVATALGYLIQLMLYKDIANQAKRCFAHMETELVELIWYIFRKRMYIG